MTKYDYVIDLDERGGFRAHVENHKTGKIVFSFNNEVEEQEVNEFGELVTVTYDGELWITEDGFMKNTEDAEGLEEYLKDMKIIHSNDSVNFVG